MFYSLANRPASRFQRHNTALINNGALDRFLDDTLGSLSGARLSQPATVEDADTAYSLQLDVPGVARDQLEIDIEGDVVRINSKAEARRPVKAAYRFPLDIDAAASSAKLENGVLTLTLAKKIPVSNVTQLAIS
ncbi:Hsp20/alpha crystallin family protein [Polaromonas sp.]|uniref:Hsp20/alpha crystallin family protein n=1 Tax=Polaromonas sp. TaxID=1869339 RepID=UPI003568A3E6